MYPSPNITCCRTVQLARCCRSASASAAAHSASNAGDSFRAFATFAARLAALRISSALASRVMAVLPVLRYHPNDKLHLWVTATAGSRTRTIRPAQYQRVVFLTARGSREGRYDTCINHEDGFTGRIRIARRRFHLRLTAPARDLA